MRIDMLTGLQISEARSLLGWSRAELSQAAFLKLDVIDRAEERDGNALLAYADESAIRRVCGRAGVEFIDHPPGARLELAARVAGRVANF